MCPEVHWIESGRMPTVFRYRGVPFLLLCERRELGEPVHIHVEKGELEAKFWLRPEVRVAYNDGYEARVPASCW